MSAFYSRRRRSQSFGSFGSYKEQKNAERWTSSDQPELVEGYAHMCFDQQALSFRGIMLTTNGTSFNLTGKRCCGTASPASSTAAPDVMRDFPSPRHSQTSIDVKTSSSDAETRYSFANTKQNSMDCGMERELQFILEEIPLSGRGGRLASPAESTRSLPVSRPGSPPSTEQIARALDNLLIHDSESVMEEPDADDANPVSNEESPPVSFRSRSGSRSQMEMVSMVFDVTICDLDEGTQHHILGVNGRSGNTCTLRNRQLCFATDRSFWGQRADMVIQKQLAAPDLVGQGCHVFAGPMRFYYNPLEPEASTKSLTNWCW